MSILPLVCRRQKGNFHKNFKAGKTGVNKITAGSVVSGYLQKGLSRRAELIYYIVSKHEEELLVFYCMANQPAIIKHPRPGTGGQ
jgi:hypothetical protein